MYVHKYVCSTSCRVQKPKLWFISDMLQFVIHYGILYVCMYACLLLRHHKLYLKPVTLCYNMIFKFAIDLNLLLLI